MQRVGLIIQTLFNSGATRPGSHGLRAARRAARGFALHKFVPSAGGWRQPNSVLLRPAFWKVVSLLSLSPSLRFVGSGLPRNHAILVPVAVFVLSSSSSPGGDFPGCPNARGGGASVLGPPPRPSHRRPPRPGRPPRWEVKGQRAVPAPRTPPSGTCPPIASSGDAGGASAAAPRGDRALLPASGPGSWQTPQDCCEESSQLVSAVIGTSCVQTEAPFALFNILRK